MENHISSSYHADKEGIINVCQQVDCIQLCQGISLENRDYYRQEHIIEEVIKLHDEEKVRRILRSTKCLMVSKLHSRNYPNCTVCQRLTVRYRKSNTADAAMSFPTNTEETIRSLLPNATEDMIYFILSQVTNSNKAVKTQHRWDMKIISVCLGQKKKIVCFR